MPCANTQKALHFTLKHGLNSPETDYFQIKIKKTLIKFCRKEKLPYLCTRLQQVRALSSAGLEHLPYKQRVGGSNPSAPTRKSHCTMCNGFFVCKQRASRRAVKEICIINNLKIYGQTRRCGLLAVNDFIVTVKPYRIVCPFLVILSINKKPHNIEMLWGFFEWALRDSNPRPSACKADALNQLS